MRYPRNAKIFRGQLDAAPFAGVFFCLVILLLLNRQLVYTPGVKIDLARADDLPGISQPSVAVALDAAGNYYFRNQQVSPAKLRAELRTEVFAARKGGQELAVIALIDEELPSRVLVRLAELVRDAGASQLLQATRPTAESGAGAGPIVQP